MKISKSEVFRTANSIAKSNNITISEALKKAWKAAKLQVRLSVGEVRFKFRKCNGEIREAVGVLKDLTEDAVTRFRGNAVCYYDVEKKGFRSFAVANLI